MTRFFGDGRIFSAARRACVRVARKRAAEASRLVAERSSAGIYSRVPQSCFPRRISNVSHLRRFSYSVVGTFIALVIFGAMAPRRASAQQINENLYSGMHWRLIGPFRGGRAVAVTGVPGQPDVFYFGAVGGGVWKTTNAGLTWKAVFDSEHIASIGAIAVATSDPNVIYVGSGEPDMRSDISYGNGMYKSTDGGATWKHIGLEDTRQIGSILVDPRDANLVYVAAMGHSYGPNAERGVFRSTDGGATWKKILFKDENTGAIDLAFDAQNTKTIYATLWQTRRPPWNVYPPSNGPGSGLYKSTDGGDNWTQLTNGLPTEGLGRVGVAVAPSNSNRVYAIVDAKNGGLYRSDDAGQTWKLADNESRIWGRGWYFGGVTVDTKNSDVLYVMNTSTYRSTDGGQSFTAIKGAPGGDDYHTIWINPRNPQIIFLGCDQGATITVNGGQTWSSWYNQPTAQFYHVATDNRFPYWVYGAQQESGSVGTASRGDYGEITFREWFPVGVEEYGYIAPDPLNPDILYGGKLTRTNLATREVQNVSPAPLREDSRYRFVRTMPIVFSPVDPHILYFAAQVVFKTTNGGNSWETISPDLTRQTYEIPPNLGVFTKSDPEHGKHHGVVYTIAPSFKDVNLIWAGTDDGLIHITRDGGRNWRNVTPPDLTPWSKVSILEASHTDPESAYAAINRFRLDDLHPYIYRTRDGGNTWQKITSGIPDNEVVNSVREDPVRKGLLFAGSERSVYVSFDDGDHWQTLRQNMPATSIRDLVIHGDDLVVGTHGRSFWILDDITPLRQLTAEFAQAGVHLFEPQHTYRIRRDKNPDTPLPPEVPAGQNPPDGAIIDYYLKAAAPGPVTLEILDSAGKRVRQFSSADKMEPLENDLPIPLYWVRPSRILSSGPGMHRFVWDLHYPSPDALEHDYPISAIVHDTPRSPQGPTVLPGEYTVRLNAGGQSYTAKLTVEMDPRVKTPPAGLEQQFQLAMQLADAMNRTYTALPKAQGDEAARLRRLNAQLGELLEVIEGADETPTTQAVAAVERLLQSVPR